MRRLCPGCRCRRLSAGSPAVVGCELDPHSHLTQKRFDAADILISFKEFSHVDFVERAEEVVELTLRAARGQVRPTMAKFDCRMIEVPGCLTLPQALNLESLPQ